MHSFYSTADLARFSFFALTLTAAAAAQAATIRVPADKPTIQSAINIARSGDKVLVAPGTYREAIDFLGKRIIVISEAGAAATIIDAQSLGKSVATFTKGETAKARLSGFTLTHGAGQPQGGGVVIRHASPTIDRNRIVDNVAMSVYGQGAGIYVGDGAPKIHHNVIARNIAQSAGGGVFLDFAITTAGSLVPEISDNTIEYNKSVGYMGGGIVLFERGAVIARNIIRYNSATAGSGITDWGSPATVVNNVVHGNIASDGVAGILIYFSAGTYLNNTVARNVISPLRDDLSSTELFVNYTSRPSLIANNIFYGSSNLPAVYCYGDSPEFQFDFNDVYSTKVGIPAVDGACAADGTNNLSIKPGFTGTGAHPYKLRPDSPLIGKGYSDAAAGTPLDLLNKPRVVGASVDMGAYELQTN